MDEDVISGWVEPSADGQKAELELLINEQSLAIIQANRYRSDLCAMVPDGKCAFLIRMNLAGEKYRRHIPKHAVLYLKSRDTGDILCEVPIAGLSEGALFANAFGERFALYQKNGGFIIPLSSRTDQWWSSVRQAMEETCARAELIGAHVHIAYGALLGYEREGGFIPHDDDVDMAVYCGEQEGVVQAAKGFYEILNKLFPSRRISVDTNGQAHVHFRFERDVSIDYFAAWSWRGRYFQNFTIDGQVTLDSILPPKSVEFLGAEVKAPRDAAVVLEAIYGPSWRVPDPGFRWSRPKSTAEFFAPLHNYNLHANIEYWNNYYSRLRIEDRQSRKEPPSQFAAFVTGYLSPRSTIIEFGCGTGRDSFFFADYGWSVIAADYSEEVIRANGEQAVSRGNSRISFKLCNVADIQSVTAVLEERAAIREAPVMFYSRFFLHAISDEAEAALTEALKVYAQPGDLVAVETRIVGDEDRPKETPSHFRRYVEADSELAKWNSGGWEVLYSATGTGFARYKSDDAYVLRMVAIKKDKPSCVK